MARISGGFMALSVDEAAIARAANRRIRRSANIAGWSFAGPSLVIVLGLSFIPMTWAAYLSLTNSDLVSGGHFIGLANYAALRKDPMLHEALKNTLLLALLYLPAGLAAGLGAAVLLNQKIKLIGFYRTCFLVPFVASAAAEGLLFSFIFDPDFGVVDAGLHALGLPRQGFLQDPSQAMFVLAIVYFWTQFGFNIVIYLAALQDISQEVLDAASIDGASRWGSFWHVAVPTIRPVTIFLFVWSLIDVLQFFDLVYTTTKGGPVNSTLTLVYYIWELAFQFFEAGYGAAVAYVLFFVSLIAIIVVLVYGRRRRLAL
jgi:multiple sugar transport system permease protein